MVIGRKFNELNLAEYLSVIENHKRYSDFNTLGLYRSLTENIFLSVKEKITIRDHAHSLFRNTFDFLQLKDPNVFVEVSTLGEELTEGDRRGIWDEVKKNQQKILADKRIKHRNFGVFSKHSCPYEDCLYQGLMVRPESRLAPGCISFNGERSRYSKSRKSKSEKINRKREKLLINYEFSHSENSN